MFVLNYEGNQPAGDVPAESLLDLATFVMDDKRDIAIAGETIRGRQLAEIRLAMEFRNRRPGLIFKAMYEGWSRERIVKEMY